MKAYDLVVVGTGAGMNVAADAAADGMEVAVVESGPLGGTCLNNGCIPSKILIHPADLIREIGEGEGIGVRAKVVQTDFPAIMARMRSYVDAGRREMEEGVPKASNLHLLRGTAEFTGEETIAVGGETIRGKKVVIASGARVLVPEIPGLRETGYVDNVSLLSLARLPEKLVIIGGGYVACEYGHFFSAMGSKVTLLGRNPRLLKEEDPEISEVFTRRFLEHVEVYTNVEVTGIKTNRDGRKLVTATDRATGAPTIVACDEILLAAGRVSNADTLHPERGGVEIDKNGWIVVDEYLRTSRPNVWALGDALGRHMFRHTANYESSVVWRNAFGEHPVKADFHAVPHAVFSWPQVAHVGLTEAEATAAGHHLLVGRSRYAERTMGYAMGEGESLVKVVVDGHDHRILGASIVGSHAAMLLQPIVWLMNAGDGTFLPMARGQTIHPALPEVVVDAFGNLR
jgi:dihydrolipoamide dehydrogenase